MQSFPPLPDWLQMEHEVAKILTNQELHGWYFNEQSARELESSLRRELRQAEELLRNKHPFVFGSEFTPRRNNSRSGYVEGCPLTKLKDTNPTSRDHIAWILSTFYGWKPTQMTTSGKPVIDETILKDAASDGITIAEDFLKCLDITKKLGMISEGVNAWQKLSTTSSRIHHHCSVATATHRCAHRSPNLGQTPSDLRFRELFTATPGQLMVGADLAGIELRMLAHYLGKYDSGRYADILLNGDIHQVNADRIGISRRQTKTISYAFLYGSGDVRLGHSFDPQLSDKAARAKGKEIRAAFVEAIDGLSDLQKAVKQAAESKGWVKSIDGRRIPVDSSHKALNFALQSGAATIAKRWLLINQQTIKEAQLCCSQLAFIHDELQFECDPKHANDLSTSLVFSAAAAGEYYKLRCPIEAEAKIGNNWAEVH